MRFSLSLLLSLVILLSSLPSLLSSPLRHQPISHKHHSDDRFSPSKVEFPSDYSPSFSPHFLNFTLPFGLGANFINSAAGNQLEMFQEETFSPSAIDKELSYAANIGMTYMRVFLHDLLWQQDPSGFLSRLDTFLTIATKYHIGIMFVLFDSCWEAAPQLGPQHPPIPGVHNSMWVQSPGHPSLLDPSQVSHYESYVKGVVGHFSNDNRVIAWDVWNEPDNQGNNTFTLIIESLLPQVYQWCREVNVTQPLTSPLWVGDANQWGNPQLWSKMIQIQMSNSDIISFHNYEWPEGFQSHVESLITVGGGRKIICTEYMARSVGSTFDTIIPIGKHYNIPLINWGLVTGRTQTKYPWSSWTHPYILPDDVLDTFFHDVFYGDGTPYRQQEVEIIKQYATME